MIFSSGEIIDRSRFLGAFIEQIEHLPKSVSQDSRNREKARIQLANTWKKARLQRDALVWLKGLERLSIDKMVKNHNLLGTLGTIDTGFY